MSLKEVKLPSGGTAWVITRLPHDRFEDMLAIDAVVVPDDGADRIRAVLSKQPEVLKAMVWRWEGVRHPITGEELAFPADVRSLDTPDMQALFAECMAAFNEALPSPKPSAESPARSSPEEPSTPAT